MHHRFFNKAEVETNYENHCTTRTLTRSAPFFFKPRGYTQYHGCHMSIRYYFYKTTTILYYYINHSCRMLLLPQIMDESKVTYYQMSQHCTGKQN